MVAVRTGFPSPMQPMGSFPPMALPAGQTPVPASVPPMPLAGFPPPPVKPPMAQQGSNAPRRRRFGDSLEGMLGRNMFAPQQQMVAPGMPMMRTPMPRPMAMGGAVQYFANGGNANQQAAASMMSAGIGNVGGKAITSGAQSVQDSFASSAKRRRKKRREKQRRLAAERAAAEQAIRDAEAAAQAVPAQQNNPNIAGPMESALQNFGGTAFQSAASSPAAQQNNPNIPSSPPPNMISATPPGFGSTPPPPPSPGMSEGLGIVNQMQDAANLQAALGAGIDATPPGFGSVPPVSPVGIQKPDRIIDREIAGPSLAFDDALALTQGVIPSEVVPENPFSYDIGAIGLGDNRDDTQANLGAVTDPSITAPPPGSTGITVPEGTAVLQFGSFAEREDAEAEIERLKESLEGFPTNYYIEPVERNNNVIYRIRGTGFNNIDDAARAGNAIISQENVIPILTRDSFTTGGLGSPQARDDTFVESLFPTSRTPPIFPPSDRGFEPEGTQIAPEAATIFGITPEEQGIVGGMSAVPGAGRKIIREKDDSFAESMFDAKPTIEEQTIIDGMSAVPDAGQKITPPKAGSSNRTGVDPQADQYRPSVNAAEAAFLQEALGQMEFDDDGKLVGAEPNFIEQVIGKIVRNLTLGMFDPNDPQKREDAKAILDAYQKTGKFVYDGKQMSITDLIEASKGAGIEPAVIGVEGPDGKTVGFDDGTGFRNIMGDFDYKKGIGSDTQNILTGSTDVFGGGDTTTNITTGGGDDGGDSGSDTTGDVDLGHTVDENGNKICNTPGYIYNPETEICELPKEEEVDTTPSSGIGTGTSGESFEDVLKRVVVAAPDVAPISANVQPMQEGGMAGLNRAADNFLQALAG